MCIYTGPQILGPTGMRGLSNNENVVGLSVERRCRLKRKNSSYDATTVVYYNRNRIRGDDCAFSSVKNLLGTGLR